MHILPDIILLCKTFLKNQNSQLFCLDGYDFFCENRQHHIKGGVGIFVRKTLNVKVLNDIRFFALEYAIQVNQLLLVKYIEYQIPIIIQCISNERLEAILGKLKCERTRGPRTLCLN